MVETTVHPARLLVYLDVAYRHGAGGYSTDRAFIKLIVALEAHFAEVALVGRVRPGTSDYAIPSTIRVIPLPDYPSLRDVPAVLAAAPRALARLWRAVAGSDLVLSIGPHPLSLPTALFARVQRKPLTLMVRQNYPAYIRHRLPSARWKPFVAVAAACDRVFRMLAHRGGVGVVAVGEELAHRYRSSPRLLDLPVSLMPASARATHPGSEELGHNGAVRLLSVTRLDPEKAPELLLDAASMVAARHPDWHVELTIVGDGPLRANLERLAAERPAINVRFDGYVPHGDVLFDRYRTHDVLVHTAKTEGIPQVVVEALTIGLPVVATDVGGVRAALAGGAAGLLVPAGDAPALAAAVEEAVLAPDARARRVERGLVETGSLTLQGQAARLAAFIAQADVA